MAKRDPYAEVGRATRAAIKRALDNDAPPYAMRCLLEVISQTATWSKYEARTTRPYLSDQCGQPERQVTRGMRWLADNGVVEWVPGRIVEGKPIASIVRLPRDTPRPEDSGHRRVRSRDTTGSVLGTPRVPDTRIYPRSRHDERLAASSADASGVARVARCDHCGAPMLDEGNGPECGECAA